MAIQNFKIKHGLNLGDHELIDALGNINLPSGAGLHIAGQPLDALPDQAGQSGKLLATNGSTAFWDTIDHYTPPVNEGSLNFLAGDGTYKSLDFKQDLLPNAAPLQVLTYVNGVWVGADLPTNQGSTFSGSYLDLTDKPALFSGSYTDLTNKPQLFSGNYYDLLNQPTLFSGSYLDLSNKPALFSGSYLDLTNKPTIPSIDGLATTASVNTLLSTKADISYVDNGLSLKANQSTTYTKTEVDTSLSAKANQSTTYTKTEVDTSLSAKANQSTTYTKTEVDTSLALKANANTPTFTGDASFNNNVVISGNLTVQGGQIITNTATMEVEDPLIYIGTGNVGNSNDIGFVGHFTSGTYQHTGLVRDASANNWKLFSGVTTEPSASTLDFTNAVYDSLQIGALTATSGDFSGNLNVTGAINRSPVITLGGDLSGSVTLADLQSGTLTASIIKSPVITLGGALTGSVTLTNLQSGTLTAAIAADAVTLGTNTIGSYVASASTSGNGISGSVNAESGVFTVTSNATNLNTASTLVYRDASGNFSAGTITAALSGNATTASTLQTARSISLSGDVTGSVSFNGSADVTIVATVAANSVALGTDTTGNYMVDLAAGTGVSISHTQGEGSTATVSIGQSVATTAAPTFAGLTSTGNVAVTGLSQGGNTILNGTDTWLRTTGATGWYSTTYTGGWYMTDTTWMRSYNDKAIYTGGAIAAAGDITAYYSDERLKEKKGTIQNPIEKIRAIETFYYVNNDLAKSFGYTSDILQVGVSAQSVKRVMPEAVKRAPFDIQTHETTGEITSKTGEDYLTVQYERLVPLLVESIKCLQDQVDELKARLGE